MDDMDDFGDLYGDLHCHMNLKEREKVESKAADVDSLAEESEPNGKMATFDAKEMLNLDEENSDEDSETDDVDDFHIVLNEDESAKFQQPKRGAVGIDEEDERDGVADGLNSDQKSSNQLAAAVVGTDAFLQRSEARGVQMSCHRPGRNAGSHLRGFPSSERASVSVRGAWDSLLVPCFQGSASYNQDIYAAAQTSGTFCLPRKRTIFDVNIEVFEQKPWRHHGADITDYFNFGLDEESWKRYCEALDQIRKQVVLSNIFPVYPTSRLNQEGRNSFVLESLEKGGREFDMPKGRAIQVEGSLGERIPSADIRRPRVLDSDVVIHINMEGTVEDPSASCKDSSGHEDEHIDTSLSTFGNDSKERVLSPRYANQIGRHITNSIEHYSPRLNEINLRATSGKVESNADCKKDDDEDLLRTDAMFRSGSCSGSGDQVLHISGSCNLQSHSEESKDVFANGRGTRPIRKPSVVESQGSIESDYYLSYDSVSDTMEYEHEHNKVIAQEQDLSSEEYRHFSPERLRSVAELNVTRDDEQTSNMIRRKHHNYVDLADIRCKTRKRKFLHHTDGIRGHLYSYRETEVSLSYKSPKHAVEHAEKIFTKDSRKSNCGTHRSRNWIDEDCVEQRECYFSERCHKSRSSRSSIRKYSDQSVSINKSFSREKHAKKREDEHRSGMDPEYDDIIHDGRYRHLGVQDMHGRHIDIYDMAEESFDLNFHRHAYATDRKIRSLERSRYDRTPSFERNCSSKSSENDADYLLFSHRYKEPYHIDESDWDDACSPRGHLRSSWRSDGRYMKNRVHMNIGSLQLRSKRYGHVVPSINDHHNFSYEDGLESDIHGYISEGNAYSEDLASSINMRSHCQLSKPNPHADDGARFRHCEQGSLLSPKRFLLEKRLKRENCQVRKPFLHSQRLLGGHLLNNARKIRVVGTSDSDARDHVNFVPGMARHELAAVGCSEAASKHLNGFKGKLARTCGLGVACEGQKEMDTGCKDDQLRNFSELKEDKKREEIYPHISKEGSHNNQMVLNVDKVQDSKLFNSNGETKVLLDKLSAIQNVEENDIEEGELIEESNKRYVVSVTKNRISGKKVENFQSKDLLRSVKVAGLYNKSRILETLAKMEKRKERFKELTAPKQESKKSVDPKVDVSVASDEVKQQRPARKRRWGGN